METLTQKKELIEWINSIEDQAVLNKLAEIKREATFDFDKEFKRGISGEELKKRISKHISSLPWKK